MISDRDAEEMVIALISNMSGWTDDAATETIRKIKADWHEVEIARLAVRHVIDTWTKPSRPTWGVLQDAYRSARRRHAVDRPALSMGQGLIMSPSDGREVAARAYAEACKRRDADDPLTKSGFRSQEPNPRFLDRLLGPEQE